MTSDVPAERARVRVRWMRGTYITDPMPVDEAAQMRTGLRDAVASLGGTYGFVNFDAHEGRAVSVRARDVVAVEMLPELPDRPAAAGPREATAVHTYPAGGVRVPVHDASYGYPAHGVVPSGGQGEIGEAPGTAFLRQQAQQRGNR